MKGCSRRRGSTSRSSSTSRSTEVTDRLRDGRVDLAVGVTEHVVLDRERGGHLAIIGGNVNKLPFSLIAGKDIKNFADLKGQADRRLVDRSRQLLPRHAGLLAEAGLHYPGDYTLVAVGPILTRWRMLHAGEIDAGLQGEPLDLIAIDQGFTALANPRERFPDFQFTSLNVDARWARAHRDVVIRFMQAFIRAHEWFYANRDAPRRSPCARPASSGVMAERAWDAYTSAAIFPRDGDASSGGGAGPHRDQRTDPRPASARRTQGDDYIDRGYLRAAQENHS